MKRAEFDKLVKEFAGDDGDLGFAFGYEIQKTIKTGSELSLMVNTDIPCGADLRKGDIVNINGFMGDGEIGKFAVKESSDGNWDVPMKYLSSI